MPQLECSTEGGGKAQGSTSHLRENNSESQSEVTVCGAQCQMMQITAGCSHSNITCFLLHMTLMWNLIETNSNIQKCTRFITQSRSAEFLADPSAVTHSFFFPPSALVFPQTTRVMWLLCCSSLLDRGGGNLGRRRTRSPSNAFSAKCDGMSRPIPH